MFSGRCKAVRHNRLLPGVNLQLRAGVGFEDLTKFYGLQLQLRLRPNGKSGRFRRLNCLISSSLLIAPPPIYPTREVTAILVVRIILSHLRRRIPGARLPVSIAGGSTLTLSVYPSRPLIRRV